jgi:hypothetical protein
MRQIELNFFGAFARIAEVLSCWLLIAENQSIKRRRTRAAELRVMQGAAALR